MGKTEKIKGLAQACLDNKWRKEGQCVFSQCDFCRNATKNPGSWPAHDCSICLIDKLVCNFDAETSLIGYFSQVYKEAADGSLEIGKLNEEDHALMIKALEEMAKDGKISKSTRKSIKKKIKSIEL